MCLEHAKGPFVVAVECAWKDTLLIEVFIGNRDDQVTAGPQNPEPIRQSFLRLHKMLQAMTGMYKIEALVFNALHELRVPTILIPNANARYPWQQFLVHRQRVRTTADIYALTDKVTIDEVRLRQPPHNCFAALFHETDPTWQAPPAI